MEKGISLVTLVITIVVMLIIAGTIVFESTDILDIADEDKLQEELTMVNNVILENYTNYLRTKNIAYIKGEKLTDTQVQEIASKINVSLVAIPTNVKEKDLNLSTYCRLTPTDLLNIGIEGAQDTYIVNYLTGEVINETKANEGVKLYMYSRSNFNRTQDVTAF